MQRKASREPLEKLNLIQTAFSFRDTLYLQLDLEISPIKPRKKMENWFLGTNSTSKVNSRGPKVEYTESEERKKLKAKSC